MTIKNFVEYAKQTWKNRPDTSTPLSAERMSYMETGIKNVSDAIKAIADAVYDEILNDSNKIASLAALYKVSQGVESNASAIKNLDANKVTSPSSAKVGQAVVVEAVDEKGKPLSYTAADNAGGSADWNVHDENADGYIKNRTHWKNVLQTYGLLYDETVVEFKNNLSTIAGVGTSNIIQGNIYIVYWNGTAYECTATGTYLGNGSLINAGDDTGEPFCFEYMTATGSYVMKSTSDAESVTIKVERPEKAEWKQLDPRFMPDMYYTEGGLVELLPETTVTMSVKNGASEGFYTSPIGLVVGHSYVVNWNGVEYECVSVDISDTIGLSCVGIGDLSEFGSTGNGEPFVVLEFFDELFIAENGICVNIGSYEGLSEVTFTITQNAEIVHKIPAKFIPEIDSDEPVITITINGDTITSDTAFSVAWEMDAQELQKAIVIKNVSNSEVLEFDYSVSGVIKYTSLIGNAIFFNVTTYDDSGISNYDNQKWKWISSGISKIESVGSVPSANDAEDGMLLQRDPENANGIGWRAVFPTQIIMTASDDDSKKFKIQVDSTGAITATKVTS